MQLHSYDINPKYSKSVAYFSMEFAIAHQAEYGGYRAALEFWLL